MNTTWSWTLGVSFAAHITAMATLPTSARAAKEPPSRSVVTLIPVSPPASVPDAPEPNPEPPDEAKPAPTPKPPLSRTASSRPSQPKPLAQAGKTLVSDAPAEEVADFTMVQGDGDAYAGGVTSSNGTAERPVAASGTEGAANEGDAVKGGGSGPGTVDRSASARPASMAWSCSHLFPREAKDVHHALVTIVVRVGPSGRARTVRVVNGPGRGFGAAARACAMGQSYVAALDRMGRPTDGFTAPISVRFVR